MEKFGITNTYDADTVGGWAGEMLEKVPQVGDSFSLEGYEFNVMEMDGFRVTRIQVNKLPEEQAEEEQPAMEPSEEEAETEEN